MPVACPLSLNRRVGQAIVNRHVSCLTELRHADCPPRSFVRRQNYVAARRLDQSSGSSLITPGHRAWPHTARPRWHCLLGQSRSLLHTRKSPRTSHQKSPPENTLLQHALQTAADNGRAPLYYFNAADVSFTHSLPFDLAFVAGAEHEHFTTPYAALGNDGHLRSIIQSGIALTLPIILAKHILDVTAQATNHPHKDGSFTITTSAEERRFLLDNGYNVADLQNWLTILTTTSSTQAARLLTGATDTPQSRVDSHSRAPPFVYSSLLRRHHLSPEALRLLVAHMPIWHADMATLMEQATDVFEPADSASFLGAPLLSPSAEIGPNPLSGAVFRAFMKLLRHARLVWPEAMPAITESLVSLLRLSPRAEVAIAQGDTPVKLITRLTTLFNRALYLVAEPASIAPFKSAVHQEAAQAIILRHMAEHNPPLLITREGYRGVVRVQLAHKKTPTEMEWARLKSPSWPPWKEDRTGMDATVGLEYGISRARQILNRMQEAGYAMKSWEHTALIYSGWDSDLSPTIQTRALMPQAFGPRHNHQVWVARIRSTRTVEQAWACFLSYEDEGLKAHQDVYLAMFEKVIEEQKRHRLDDAHLVHGSEQLDDLDPLYPGDTKEVFSPPISAHQATYTKTPPPSVRDLHERMLAHGIAPSGRTLAFLVSNATNLEEGLAYILSASLEYRGLVETLVYGQQFSVDDFNKQKLNYVPDSVFAALVRLLARFPYTFLRKSFRGRHTYGANLVDLRQPLAIAIYLLDKERRQYRPAWNALLYAFARRKAPTLFSNWRQTHSDRYNSSHDHGREHEKGALDKMVAYKHVKHTLSLMDEIDLTLDTVGFRWFCIATEHAAAAAGEIMVNHNPVDADQGADEAEPGADDKARHENTRLIELAKEIQQEAQYVRDKFWTLVGCIPVTESSDCLERALPTLLAAPSPAVLHAYIRALGYLRDHEGLRELVVWMRAHWVELRTRKDVDRNGEIVFRRCIVALRVFLEEQLAHDSWVSEDEQSIGQEREQNLDQAHGSNVDDNHDNPMSCLDTVRDMVDGVEEWHGWATDEEVLAYTDTGRP